MIGRSIYCGYLDFTEWTTKVTKCTEESLKTDKISFSSLGKSQPLFWCLHQIAKKSKKQSGSATCFSEITLCCMSLAPLYTHIHTKQQIPCRHLQKSSDYNMIHSYKKRKRASPLEQQVGFSHHHRCHSHKGTHPSLVRRCLQCQKTVFNRDLQDLNNSTYRRDLVRNLALIWFAVISF